MTLFSKECLEQFAKKVIGMQVTDGEGHVMGVVINSEIVSDGVHITAKTDTIFPNKAKYIKFSLGLKSEE